MVIINKYIYKQKDGVNYLPSLSSAYSVNYFWGVYGSTDSESYTRNATSIDFRMGLEPGTVYQNKYTLQLQFYNNGVWNTVEKHKQDLILLLNILPENFIFQTISRTISHKMLWITLV